MLDQAAREPPVHVVRASISPTNLASRGLVAQFGFSEIGEQCDEEDGLETIFEVRGTDRPTPRADADLARTEPAETVGRLGEGVAT